MVGFESARDFVAYIAESYDAIYEGKQGSLIFHKKGSQHASIVSKLEPSEGGDLDMVYITVYIQGRGILCKPHLYLRTAEAKP